MILRFYQFSRLDDEMRRMAPTIFVRSSTLFLQGCDLSVRRHDADRQLGVEWHVNYFKLALSLSL